MNELWELADRWEYRFKNKAYGPVARYAWRQAWEELTGRLGERPPIDGKDGKASTPH